MLEEQQRSRSQPNLGTDSFDSSVVEAAWAYHRQIGCRAKGNVPVEVAAFIAGACLAKEVLVGERKDK
jgi:hypothetical protein